MSGLLPNPLKLVAAETRINTSEALETWMNGVVCTSPSQLTTLTLNW